MALEILLPNSENVNVKVKKLYKDDRSFPGNTSISDIENYYLHRRNEFVNEIFEVLNLNLEEPKLLIFFRHRPSQTYVNREDAIQDLYSLSMVTEIKKILRRQ